MKIRIKIYSLPKDGKEMARGLFEISLKSLGELISWLATEGKAVKTSKKRNQRLTR